MASIYDVMFDQLGAIFARIGELRAAARAYAPIDLSTASGINVIRAEYPAASLSLIDALADQDRDGMFIHPLMARLKAAAERTIIETVNELADVRVTNVHDALREIAATLDTEGESVNDSAVTVAPTARGGNSGNGTILTSLLAPTGLARGEMLAATQDSQCIRAEDWFVTCTADQNAGLRSGNEQFTVHPSEAFHHLDRRYPGGSGGGPHILNATVAAIEQSRLRGQNILRNGQFEDPASSIAPGWAIRTGSAGVTVGTTATAYDGSSAMRFIGDDSTNAAYRQQLGSTDGSVVPLVPDELYALWLYTRGNSGTITKTITAQLTDAAAGNIGVTGAVSVTDSSHGASYARMSGFIQTPPNLQVAAYYLDISQTGTALATGEEIYFDGAVLAPAWSIAPLGGGIVIVGGSTPYRKGDHFDITWTNDYAGLVYFYLDLLFDCRGHGIVFPVASSPTIPDSIIA